MVVKLSLPDKVLHYQKAVVHYLRQNLLQPDMLFHPKYQDSACRFMDYTESPESPKPMVETNTFLYTKSAGYSIAGKGAGMPSGYSQQQLHTIYTQNFPLINYPESILF